MYVALLLHKILTGDLRHRDDHAVSRFQAGVPGGGRERGRGVSRGRGRGGGPALPYLQ